MYLIDVFLGGEFSKYGVKVLQFSNWDGDIRHDPMIQVFPRITKCRFHKYGSSGDLEKIDALCILPINILNEKIFIFIWFWFIILAVMSGLVLIYRIVLLFWPASRFMVTSCRSRLVKSDDLRTVLSRCWLGDWFVLDLLAKNLDSLNFRDVVSHFAEKLEGRKGVNSFP
ncbi:innexin inx2 [Caerostris extrusa]|uniref:Innexin n=1 Tax=Caerostris extrusa TaxID=172846 RepID=A0AAV4QE98_CAEEX|nr:innexin inx2 [Caerostris extrusa]